jgi:hypothetical protein
MISSSRPQPALSNAWAWHTDSSAIFLHVGSAENPLGALRVLQRRLV